jgi:hypothetical protein
MDPPFDDQLIERAEIISKFDGYRGNIIGIWACIESAMDRANHYAWWYSDQKVAAMVPVSLGRKIKLFKEINRDLAPFRPLKEQAERLSWAVDELFEDRHWLAHGYLDVAAHEKDQWIVEKHAFPKETGGLVTIRRSFSEEDLQMLRLKLRALAHEFSRYLRALAQQVEKHAADDKRG